MAQKSLKTKQILLIITLVLGSFVTVLNQTLLATAYPDLMKDFSVSTAKVQWLTTGFLLVNGIMIPVTGYLMTNIKTKRLYLSAMLIFLLGTYLAFSAKTFNMLLVGRLVQAVGVGISMPLLQTIMLSIFPKDKRGSAMGITGIVVGLAPAIGPTLSGWVVQTYTWRYLFGMLLPIIVLVIIMALFFVTDVLELEGTKLDVLSPLLSTFGFGMLLYGFSIVGDKSWLDPEVLLFLALGIVGVILFALRQLRSKVPFLEIQVFKQKTFRQAALLGGLTNMALVGVEMILPLYIQKIRGLSPLHSGLTLLPGALLLGLMMPITGKLFDKYGSYYLSIIGMTLLTLGTFPFVFLTESTPMIRVTLLYAVRMLGISMTMMPVTTAGMNALPDKLISHGTAVNNMTKQVFSSIGTAVLVSSLTQTTTAHMPNKDLLKTQPAEYKHHFMTATLDGYHIAFIISCVFSVLGIIVAMRMDTKKQPVTNK